MKTSTDLYMTGRQLIFHKSTHLFNTEKFMLDATGLGLYNNLDLLYF